MKFHSIYTHFRRILPMALAGFASLLGACSSSPEAPGSGTSGEDMLRLSFAISASTPTRAVDSDTGESPEESAAPEIESVTVMLFTAAPDGSPDILWKAVAATNLEDFGDDKKRFDVKIGIDPSDLPNPLIAVALTNASDRLPALKAGEGMGWKYEDCRALLLSDHESRQTAGFLFTHWGIAEKAIDTDIRVQSVRIRMVRDLARICVHPSEKVAAENFRIAYALVYNRFNGISMMPMLSNIDGNGLVTAPTLTSAEKTVCETYTVRPYSETPADFSALIPEQDITMGENASAEDANRFKRPALIVGGYYRGNPEKVYWYRADFLDSDGGPTDVLRNHSYTFNITAVNGPGEETPGEAYYSLTAHVEAEVVAWNDISRDAAFDGSNWIALPRSVTLGPDAGAEAEVRLFSNVAPSIWEAAWGDPGADCNSLSFSSAEEPVANVCFSASFPAEAAADNSVSVKIKALSALPEGTDSRRFTLYLNITPRLRMAVPVVQSANVGSSEFTDWGEQNIFGEI